MTRLSVRYRLATDDFSVADGASDALMEALLKRDDVVDPDVAVSMTEGSLEVWLSFRTDDVFEAQARGASVLASAFAEAGLDVAPSEHGLVLDAVDAHAELLPA